MIIEPGQDLGIGSAGEPVVREVRLPALVRLLGGEPDVRRPGPLGRVRVTRQRRDRYLLIVAGDTVIWW
jgi:hypothetical protein